MAPTQKPASTQRRLGRPPKGTRGDTRRDLLEAALRLFAKQGYAATTVRQIADEIDIRDSAIYAHFNAKQDLLDALVEESGLQLLERSGFDFSLLLESHPADVLPSLFTAVVGEWDRKRNRQLISLFTREGLAGPAEGLAHLRERLEDPFARWAAQGVFRDDVSPELLLWELTTPLAAVRIFHLNAQSSTAERKRARKLVDEHVDYFLKTAVVS